MGFRQSKKVLPILFLLAATMANGMVSQITKIEVLGKTPGQLYDFMFGLDKEKYLAWHPEHKDFKIVKQTKDTVGSIFFFHEKMDKLKVKYKWEVLEISKNHRIVMKARYFIPIYLTLTFAETPNGTLVTHDLRIGYARKITGFMDWFIGNLVFTKSKRHSQDRHAVEEFKNLESLIKN